MKKWLILLLLAFTGTAWAQAPDNALKAEGISEDVIPFTGKLVNHGSSLFIAPSDYTTLENFRYYKGGIATRKGMTKYTSNTSGTTVAAIIPYIQPTDDSQFILVGSGTSGYKYYDISSGAYSGTTTYQTTGTGVISYAKAYDTLVVADGSDIWAYSGTTTYPKMVLQEKTAGVYVNGYDWIYDGSSHTIGSGTTVYFGYPRPFTDTEPDKDDGWTGTASGSSPEFKAGHYLYWSEISGATTVEMPKIKVPAQTLTGNLWGGDQWMYAQACIVQISGTSSYHEDSYWVKNSSTETYSDISELESGGTVYLSFPWQTNHAKLFFPETNVNTTLSTLSAQYWDGDSWESVSGLSDGTDVNGACFGQTGIITFTLPSDWEKRTIGESTFEGYPLALKVSAAIDNYVRIYKVVAIPSPDSINTEHWHMVGAYRDRLVLADGDDKSVIRISSEGLPDTFIGYDSTYTMVGDRNGWIALVQNLNSLLMMKEDGNYVLTGVNPDTFTVQKLKGTVPGVAGNGVVAVQKPDGVYVIYMAADGVYLLSPSGQNSKISEDIKAYWETGNSLAIPADKVADSVGWYDRNYNEIHFAIASGSETLNKEIVFNLDYNRWSVFSRKSALQCGAGFVNASDRFVTLGAGADGYIYTLESGSDDDGTDIDCEVTRKPYTINNRIGNSYMYALGFYYNLPESTISGTTVTVTSGIGGAISKSEYTVTLDDSGLFCDRMTSDADVSNGSFHTFDFDFTGRIELWRQIIWNKRGHPLNSKYPGGVGAIVLEDGGYLLLE